MKDSSTLCYKFADFWGSSGVLKSTHTIVSSDHTPTYKHPELRGQSIDFDEVGLYGELK